MLMFRFTFRSMLLSLLLAVFCATNCDCFVAVTNIPNIKLRTLRNVCMAKEDNFNDIPYKFTICMLRIYLLLYIFLILQVLYFSHSYIMI